MPSLRLLPLALLAVILAGCGDAKPSSTVDTRFAPPENGPFIEPGGRAGYAMVSAAAFSPDGKTLLVGYKIVGSLDLEHLVLYEVPSGKKLRSLKGHTGRIAFVGFLRNGSHAVSASGDGTVRLWSISSGQQLSSAKVSQLGMGSVTLSRDGQYALCFVDKRGDKTWSVVAKLIELPRVRLVLEIDNKELQFAHSIALAPNADLFIAAPHPSGQKHIELRDLNTMRLVHSFSANGSWGWAGTFAPDGQRLLCQRRSDQAGVELVIFDIASWRELRRVSAHDSDVEAAFYTPDGKRILSAGREDVVSLWDVSNGNQLWTHNAPVDVVALSKDGKTAFTAAWRVQAVDSTGKPAYMQMLLWDVATGKSTPFITAN